MSSIVFAKDCLVEGMLQSLYTALLSIPGVPHLEREVRSVAI